MAELSASVLPENSILQKYVVVYLVQNLYKYLVNDLPKYFYRE